MSHSPRPPIGFAREEFARLLRVMSLPFAACLVFFLVTPSGIQSLHRSTAEVRRQIVGVVESQLVAFRDGDYARAYSFAASGIQQQFNVASFERMVKDGYPLIAYWRAVSFREAADNGHEAVLVVLVQGRGGRTRLYRYLLVREASEWRVNGVMEIDVSPATQGQLA